MMTYQVLTSEQEIGAIALAWRALQERLGLSPFTGYDWAKLWWDTIGKPSGATLMVVAGFAEGRLVGLLPFSIRRAHGVRVLRLLGHEIYYYRTFLIEREEDSPTLWQVALEQPCFDFADIKNIHTATPEKAFLDRFAVLFEKGIVRHQEHHGETRQALLDAHHKAFRHKIRRIEKRLLGDEPELKVFCTQESPPSDVVDFLVRRKKDWVEEKGKRGIFHDDNVFSFYRGMVRLAAQNKSLVVFWMTLQGKIVGTTLHVVEKAVVYGHTVAWDYSAARFMPGIYLNMEAIMWASEHGYAESNLMEGNEPYKARLVFQNREVFEYVYTRTIVGKTYLCLYRLLRGFRAIKEKVLRLRQAKE